MQYWVRLSDNTFSQACMDHLIFMIPILQFRLRFRGIVLQFDLAMNVLNNMHSGCLSCLTKLCICVMLADDDGLIYHLGRKNVMLLNSHLYGQLLEQIKWWLAPCVYIDCYPPAWPGSECMADDRLPPCLARSDKRSHDPADGAYILHGPLSVRRVESTGHVCPPYTWVRDQFIDCFPTVYTLRVGDDIQQGYL